ncbi:MAG: DUF4097 family beta strand repeat protein [Candidatus Hydrogenedentes bacterium]|nr:DUF4097 family beta strand repeat protein [Candidatus Hydrogenedentota bacterium]
MSANLKSVLTAAGIALLIITLCVRLIAPKLPPLVGRADVHEVRDFVHANPGTLRLDSTDGLVTVVRGQGNSIACKAVIRAFRRGDTSNEELRRLVADLVRVREEQGTLIVQTEPEPRRADFDIFVQYDFTVPEGTNVEITSNNGNVWVREGCGDVRIVGRNSDIDIVRPLGTVDVQSVNGRIQLAEAPKGATLRTVNGDVYAAVAGGRLDASTDNGVIHASLLGAGVEEATLTSQNGGVNVKMANDASASITATALRGNVESQFVVNTSEGAQQPRYLKGTIGDGRARINLDTLNGNIVIARSE